MSKKTDEKQEIKSKDIMATGRRKTAVAKVRMAPGSGKITINDEPFEQYLGRKIWEIVVKQPLEITNMTAKFDIIADTNGGGIAGQAGAVRHGIARALIKFDPELRPALKKAGFLTRDPRMRERKKYGRKRARKRFQWTKR